MDKEGIIIILLKEKFFIRNGLYRLTYNAVKHFAEFKNDSIRFYSFMEGTPDTEPFNDTGFLDKLSTTMIQGIINNLKQLKQ